MRQTATALITLLLAAVLAGCGGGADSASDGGDNGVIVTPHTPEAGASPAAGTPTEAEVGSATATPTAEQVSATLSGFIFPIVGGCLPSGDQLMPNAPREYRNGTHEGVDFYAVDNCTQIGLGTEVVAAKAGIVIRADHDYVDLTAEEYARVNQNLTSAESLDVFRGRQVWIDHGNGIVTRYCHLSDIPDGIVRGARVNAGDLVAFVGESGTPESINNPGSQYHLHFEVRVGDSFLGAGLPPPEVRALYVELFGQ